MPLDPDHVARPVLGQGGPTLDEAVVAVHHLVDELQAGIDTADADLYNRHFATDVMWGSPYGATVDGYDDLHAIHTELHRRGVAGPSCDEVAQALTPAPDVAVAHVRRQALDDEGRPLGPLDGFSEMALYVLVRRDGAWWLAAGQNTPVRPPPGP